MWKLATALPGGTMASQAARNGSLSCISNTGNKCSNCSTVRTPINGVELLSALASVSDTVNEWRDLNAGSGGDSV